VQARAVDLPERGGGHGFGVDLGVQLREPPAEFTLDARVGFRRGEGRHLVLQGGEFLDVGERQEVGARGERLPDLDEGRPEADESAPEPRGLPVESFIALLRVARAAEDEAAHRAREEVCGLTVNVAAPLLEECDAAARARLLAQARGHAPVELAARVVVVEKKEERERAEDARDLERPPQAGEAARAQGELVRRRVRSLGRGRRDGVGLCAHVRAAHRDGRSPRAVAALRRHERERFLRAAVAVPVPTRRGGRQRRPDLFTRFFVHDP
jgi:hypothetical protein